MFETFIIFFALVILALLISFAFIGLMSITRFK